LKIAIFGFSFQLALGSFVNKKTVMTKGIQQEIDYNRIEKAIYFIEQNFNNQPSLADMAEYVNLSEYHFERMFTKWAGTSPLRFMRFLTKEYAKKLLNKSPDVLQTTLDLGMTSTSRLHDLFVTFEAMTPAEYKNQGKGLAISYGFGETPFGLASIFTTEKGILELAFIDYGTEIDELARVKGLFPAAQFIENEVVALSIIEQIFYKKAEKPLQLLLRGTNFQIKVWEALLTLNRGHLACYEDIATEIGKITAQRAVGTAIGANHIAYIIPCHRVIQKVGTSGNYRWGSTRKRAMIGWEAAQINV
jgi:AraC family transcriptional regulator, regulatory protein of adaptative response / methylated-DNA-[protein]-cysteine methyltransferase